MNYFLFILKSSASDLIRNKMRTVLTSLGILIGVSSVVLLLAFGLGLKAYIGQQFESLGTNTIYLLPGNVISGGSFQSGSSMDIRFDNRDASTVKRASGIAMAVPMYSRFAKVSAGKKSASYEIAASSADVFPLLSVTAGYGSLFTKTDAEKGSKKIVVGPNVAKKLFDSEAAAVGKTVTIEGQSYRICGVAKPKGGGGMGMPSIDDHVYMPFKAAYSMNPNKTYLAIYMKAKDADSIEQAKTNVKKALLKRYKEDEFSIVEQKEFLSAINSIFNILNMVLVAIAAISLVVGGVGIMNIMYVTVTERIREIGIRRAIGARKSDILFMFLAQSVMLSVTGGLIGLGLSFIVVLLVRQLFPAYIDGASVAIALSVSSLVGVVFGVFPAKRASDLSPIEAIRYE